MLWFCSINTLSLIWLITLLFRKRNRGHSVMVGIPMSGYVDDGSLFKKVVFIKPSFVVSSLLPFGILIFLSKLGTLCLSLCIPSSTLILPKRHFNLHSFFTLFRVVVHIFYRVYTSLFVFFFLFFYLLSFSFFFIIKSQDRTYKS